MRHLQLIQQTVTYICEHGETMGIVINKPLDLQLADIFEHLNIQPLLSHDEVPVMAGGPVKVDRGFVLHSPDRTFDATLKVNADVWLTTSKMCLPICLVALGYAGYRAGNRREQLVNCKGR